MELLRTAFAQLVARDEKTRVGEEETEEKEDFDSGNEVSIASDVDAEEASGRIMFRGRSREPDNPLNAST